MPTPADKAFQRNYGGGSPDPLSFEEDTDAYMLVLGPLASRVSYATYLGGGGPTANGYGNEKGTGIVVNPVTGDVYVTGTTNSGSPPFPTRSPHQEFRPQHGAGSGYRASSHDVFAARFRPGAPSTTTTLLPTIPVP